MKSGTITLLIGPVFSGKTTELIRQLNRHRVMNKNTCLILPEKNKDHLDKFNFINKNIYITSNLISILPNLIKHDIVAIDNLHCFDDCLDVIPIIADKLHKTVICAGLDNNYCGEYFPNVLNLIPKSEYVYKLTAFCSSSCDGSDAIFSQKNNDHYVAVSRNVFLGKTDVGFLHIITGPMFSGKTTELIRIAKKYQSINKKILAINYSKDTRYDEEAAIFSHDKEKFASTLALDTLDNLLKEPYIELVKNSDIILIDEVQFFRGCFDIIKSLIEEFNKTVIISGLDGDYLQNPFGDVCKLIAYADKLTRLNAICKIGQEYTDASFSRRIVKSDLTELIGSNDIYVAVSREMYNLPEDQFQNFFIPQSQEQLDT